MRKILHSLVIVLLCMLPNLFFGQQTTTVGQQTTSSLSTGVPGACGNTVGPNFISSTASAGNPSVQNGTNVIGNIYSNTMCGLDFTQASQRLGKRFTPQGINQPAPLVIAGIPATGVIQKAYLWAEGSGNGAAQTATVNGPLGIANYPMAVCGNGPDKCWGYAGSYTYRADVTASVNGNGTYNISGIMTNPPTAGNDMDGATLLVIWSDPTQPYQGTIIIDDGAMINTVVNGSVLHTMTFPAVCGPTTGAQAFCGIGDLQFNGSTVTMNGTPGPYAWNWWNYIQDPTIVTAGQTSANFTVFSPGDCYNLCICGLYFRTTCGATVAATSTPTTCANCNGTATATVTPVGAYTYSWSTNPIQTTATATNLCAGTYTCTVTSSCITSTVVVTVAQVGGVLTTAEAITNVSCNGGCNGSCVTTLGGGTAPYTVVWTPAATNNTVGNINTATGLCPGTYTINVTDASGCTGSNTITITQPTAITTTQSQVNILCNGGTGSATVTHSGGTGPYTYTWTPAQGNVSTATGLTVGNYSCTVTDANGCTATTNSFTLTQPPALTIVAPSQTNVTCNGGCNGIAICPPAGGTPPYTYLWTPTSQNTQTATALCAGNYNCTVTDANGCTIIQPYTITQPTLMTVAVGGFNVTCFNSCNGQVVVIPTGGTPNYTFLWNTGCNTASCNNVCAGTYNVTVTDANGCIATGTATVTQPTAITITTTEVNAHCNQNDGSASANASGGTGNLNYQWIGGPATANFNNVGAGTYSVIVTDANSCSDTATVTVNNIPGVVATLGPVINATCFGSCNGSIITNSAGGNGPYSYSWTPNNSVTNSMTNACAGNYTMVATDSDGCTSTVIATITQPTQLTITGTATPTAVCVGSPSNIICTPGGGTPNYNVVWTPGNLIGTSQNVTPASTTTYTATVIDANGCIDSTTVAVVVDPVPTAALSGDRLSGCVPLCVNFSDISTVANPGTITAWNWDFGDNSPISNVQNPSHCFTSPGVYTVTLNVKTADGCTNTIVMNAYIDVFASPIANFGATPQPTTILNPTITFSDSSINATSWNWSFGDLFNSTSTLQNPSFTYIDTTCYQVVLSVSSANGCTDSTTKNICIGPDASIYIPNAFTPNGDGINDVFMPLGMGLEPDHFQMWIFDRWGNLIFYTNDLNKGWDGKVQGTNNLCQIDAYVWKIKALDVTGHNNDLIGRVSLVK